MCVQALDREPVRFIQITPCKGGWRATYRGDEWTARFRSETGTLSLVTEAVRQSPERCGLPIVIFNEVAF